MAQATRVEQHNKKHSRSNAIWVGLLLVVGLVWGQMSTAVDDQEAEQAHYCEMVAEGAWPDYKGTYEEFCK